MESHYPKAYNLGSGKCKWGDWINVDGNGEGDITADLRDLSMIESDTADAVAAIHVLEHFYAWEAEPLLTEWKRILKPGGVLILELPDMNKVWSYISWCYLNHKGILPFMSTQAIWGGDMEANPAMAHKYGWFEQQLMDLLKKVGFKTVVHTTPRYHFKFRDMRMEATK